ncbi:polyprenyl synthetase family protein [Streptomyces sp. NBC_00691]|uniref:polyprenyl synthetase family protein n=1 Tax=Streptomyces sp. NBC_00691 TaxID=2903671 RepID=UPI002E335D19|nr:polyprenyl synthetase family protein [Streptomyces sp. NBC_00691]
MAGAVIEDLRTCCADFVDYSRSLDAVFAADVAERLVAFTLAGGSLIRPRFLWWALRASGGGDDAAAGALRIASALELIQSCALVHDDVMDESAVRRGRPSLHTQIALRYPSVTEPPEPYGFPRSAAVLAGDLALSWADDLVAAVDLAPATRATVLRIWRAMRTEMIAGQYLDLHGQATFARSQVQAIRTVCLKTARYSVEHPIALGSAVAGADEPTTRELTVAGRYAGIAFQLRNDLLGVFGAPEVTGKPAGEDIRSGKATYLLALAHSRARATGSSTVTDLLRSSRETARLSETDLATIREVLRSTGAPALVERRIERLLRASERHLASAGLRGPGVERLSELLRQVTGAPYRETAAAPAGSGRGTAAR